MKKTLSRDGNWCRLARITVNTTPAVQAELQAMIC
jgi:hypothetical protein